MVVCAVTGRRLAASRSKSVYVTVPEQAMGGVSCSVPEADVIGYARWDGVGVGVGNVPESK